jgi:hypothetical protein
MFFSRPYDKFPITNQTVTNLITGVELLLSTYKKTAEKGHEDTVRLLEEMISSALQYDPRAHLRQLNANLLELQSKSAAMILQQKDLANKHNLKTVDTTEIDVLLQRQDDIKEKIKKIKFSPRAALLVSSLMNQIADIFVNQMKLQKANPDFKNLNYNEYLNSQPKSEHLFRMLGLMMLSVINYYKHVTLSVRLEYVVKKLEIPSMKEYFSLVSQLDKLMSSEKPALNAVDQFNIDMELQLGMRKPPSIL